ncbi:MAG: nucleotidyltransferase family protein [Selenomonadaceae bacterium]|nr:nucleotidyltransferase family protein [Selenomonadaceae bacterium]
MIAGIVAEYNPFHSGHEFQISEVKKFFPDAEIIAVMSGSFTQRGTPAILDKWTRARLAVEGGCDLILELPFTSAVRSAQDFARGGVRILKNLGIVDKIIFGAEFSDLKKLQSAAKIFDEKIFHNELKKKLSAGISYAAAVTKILSEKINLDEKILRQPNTILAIEYLRTLPKNIEPILIQRVGAGYNDLTLQKNFSSASAIRRAVYEKNPDWEKISASVNKKVLDALIQEKNFGLVRENFLFRPILSKIFTSNIDDAKKIFGMSEGLENLLFESAKSAKNFPELINFMTSRRYQTSRIKRLLLYFLLNLTAEKISEIETADFVRVLAFNERGRKILKKIRQNSPLPIVNKVSSHLKKISEPYQKNLSVDIIATNLRGILFDVPKIPNQDFLTSPQILF